MQGIAEKNALITVSYDTERPTVLGRDLHEALEIKTAYKDWFPRMCEYGFVEGADFNPLKIERVQFEGAREVCRHVMDHQLTIDMAKEICMIQRTDIGKKCREYFLSLERQWNSPESVMSRALQFANRQLEDIKRLNLELTNTVAVQKQQISEMEPKAEYFDDLVERNTLTGIRETAKELRVKQNELVNYLLENRYLYRDQKGKLQPFAHYVEKGLFELKECSSRNNSWSGTQLMVTPRGRETIRLLMKAD